jgi:hypothetical protein
MSVGLVTRGRAATGAGPVRVRAAIALAGYGHPETLDPSDPPLLLVHGDADQAVPFARARRCARPREEPPCAASSVAGHRTLFSRPIANARRAAAWLRRIGVG